MLGVVQVLEVGGAEAEAPLETAARGLRVAWCHDGDENPGAPSVPEFRGGQRQASLIW